MTRREAHYDAMLRHLGATYYQTRLIAVVARRLQGTRRWLIQLRGEDVRRLAE